MVKTLSPYNIANMAKTAEIMSRYRPIAPKPEVPESPMSESPKIRQSPYLRNLWPQLQARPIRTRKRGRTAISPPAIKRSKTHIFGFSSPCHLTSPTINLSLQGFDLGHGVPQLTLPKQTTVSEILESPPTTTTGLVTLPFLPCNPSVPAISNQNTIPERNNCVETFRGVQVIDLNEVAEIPEEKDLLVQLQSPPNTKTIAPHPVRPVGSSITVGCINDDATVTPVVQVPKKKPEEVEEEVESEAMPAVISDSNNKVRMANAAYKEMVGQPECSWLDSIVSSSCKRICGEVMLHFPESEVPVSSNRFSCWVRIEWGRDGQKNSVNAFCDVIRLCCESKDYLFTWRFHPHAREVSQSSCDV